jgi:hypothetical protein
MPLTSKHLSKYPTQNLICVRLVKLWGNPYYKSIADTQHIPHYNLLRLHQGLPLEQASADLQHKGIYVSWHPAFGQAGETPLYREAIRIIGKPNSPLAKIYTNKDIAANWPIDVVKSFCVMITVAIRPIKKLIY